jgi:hypothetical protein
MRFNIYLIAGIHFFNLSCKTEKKTKTDENKPVIVKEYHSNGKVKSETEGINGKANGLMKNYNLDGNLETVYTYKDGKRQGPAVEYYPDGKLKMKMNYKDDKREGLAIWYYKSGKIFREIPYKGGQVEGIKKSYYEDGKIMAEAPYLNDYPGIDLKEYNSKGVLIKDDTQIVIKETNRSVAGSLLYLELTLSQSHPGITFFHGELKEGKYISESLWPLPYENGKSRYTFPLPSKGAKIEPIIFIAIYQTDNSNFKVITKKYTPRVVDN